MTTATTQKEGNVSSQLVMMSLARLTRLAQEAQAAQRSSVLVNAPQVVTIREAPETGSAAPLVLIHPIGGSIMPYRDLSAGLKPDRAIFGIEARGDDERNTLHHSHIGSLAEDYLDQLSHLRLGSRIVLGGYSLGGAVAFEMAGRLQKRGVTVDTVLIIDTPARIRRLKQSGDEPVTTRELLIFGQILAGRLNKKLQIEAAELDQLSTGERVQHLLDKLRELKVIGGASGDAVFHSIYEMARHNEQLQRNFEPQPYNGNLSLVRTLEEAPEIRAEAGDVCDERAFGWQPYCTREISVKHVPGSHFQLLYPPYLQQLAKTVQEVLDEKSPA